MKVKLQGLVIFKGGEAKALRRGDLCAHAHSSRDTRNLQNIHVAPKDATGSMYLYYRANGALVRILASRTGGLRVPLRGCVVMIPLPLTGTMDTSTRTMKYKYVFKDGFSRNVQRAPWFRKALALFPPHLSAGCLCAPSSARGPD